MRDFWWTAWTLSDGMHTVAHGFGGLFGTRRYEAGSSGTLLALPLIAISAAEKYPLAVAGALAGAAVALDGGPRLLPHVRSKQACIRTQSECRIFAVDAGAQLTVLCKFAYFARTDS